MKIAPVGFNTVKKQNFKGIIKHIYDNELFDKQFEMLYRTHKYNYYPFKDETPEDTYRLLAKHKGQNSSFQCPKQCLGYFAYGINEDTEYDVKRPLKYTKEDFNSIQSDYNKLCEATSPKIINNLIEANEGEDDEIVTSALKKSKGVDVLA